MNFQNNYNYQNTHKKTYIFDPSMEVKSILKLPSNERKLALENFYKNLEKYHADLVAVFDYARTEFGDLDLSNKTDEEIDTEIEKFLKKFGEKIENFDEKTKNKILEWVAKYTENKKNAYKKLKEFEENPLKFLQENGFKGESLDEIQGKIEVDEYRGNVVIYVDKVNSKFFHSYDLWGFYRNGLIVIYRDYKWLDSKKLLDHENQHSENKILMADFNRDMAEKYELYRSEAYKIYENAEKRIENGVISIDEKSADLMDELRCKMELIMALTYFKDELIAQVKSWENYRYLKEIFLQKWGTYDYVADYLDFEDPLYERIHEEYDKYVAQYVDVIKKAVREKVNLDILSVTPMNKWTHIIKAKRLVEREKYADMPEHVWEWLK